MEAKELMYELDQLSGLEPRPLSLGELANWLQRCKNAKKQIKKLEKVVNGAAELVEKELIEKMDDADIEKVSGDLCSVTRGVSVKANLKDVEQFLEWVVKTGRYEFVRKQVNDAPVAEMLENENEVPPGVDTYLKDKLNTRRKS